MHTALPDWARAAIVEALPVFGRKLRGYDMADAVLTALETRTSSPLRTEVLPELLADVQAAAAAQTKEGAA